MRRFCLAAAGILMIAAIWGNRFGYAGAEEACAVQSCPSDREAGNAYDQTAEDPAHHQRAAIYLRVVARDNSAASQREKLRVRDAVRTAWMAARQGGEARLSLLAEAAGKIAPDCRICLRIWTPNEKTPPAWTVYITVGAGRGRNWWGILCEDAVYLTAPKKEDTNGIILDWPVLRRIWEWLGLCPSGV